MFSDFSMALIYMTMDAVKCHELYNVGGILCERNFWGCYAEYGDGSINVPYWVPNIGGH